MAKDSEKILKKVILGASCQLKQMLYCAMYVTEQGLIFQDQKGNNQKIPYTHIHEFIPDRGRVSIRFVYPRSFFGSREEYIRLSIVSLQRIEGGGIKAVPNPKWADAWKNYLSDVHETHLHDLAARYEAEQDDLLFIERIERSTEGLETCENVKSREKMIFTCPNGFSKKLKVYITNKRILIKLKSSDYLIIPYSLVYEVFSDKKEATLRIKFAYPQCIDGINDEISEAVLQRIPVDGETYSHVHNARWVEEWDAFFAEVLTLFAPKNGVIDFNKMVEILDEMKHSPVTYNLSSYAQRGWATACASAIDQLKSIGKRDLYLYMKYLIDEYENWQVRATAEPNEARRKAYEGSVQALSSILKYVAQQTMLKE